MIVPVPPDLALPSPSAGTNEFYLDVSISRAHTSSTPASTSSSCHLEWRTTHNETIIQQRSFPSQALAACWQTSSTELFPCVLSYSEQSLHFLTLSTPPTCIPLSRPYDAIYTLGECGVLLHDSRTDALAILRKPFHVEDPPVDLYIEGGGGGGRDALHITWTSARAPLFLAHRSSRTPLVLFTVDTVDARVRGFEFAPTSDAQPQKPPTLTRDGSRWRLELDGNWAMLMQNSTGGLVVIGSSREDSKCMEGVEEEGMEHGMVTNKNNEEDKEEDTPQTYAAMLECVDAERRRRAAIRATSLNVLGGDAPTEDVQKLPFHLAYAACTEKHKRETTTGAERHGTSGSALKPATDLDTRSFEAHELLCSTRPVILKSQDVGGTDDDSNNRYQQQLMQAAKRTLALALGRGAMYLGSYLVSGTLGVP